MSNYYGTVTIQPTECIGTSLSSINFNANNFDNLIHQLSGSASLSSVGYQTFGSGLIMQWGETPLIYNSQNVVTVSFPVVFPNACIHQQATWIKSSPGVGNVGNADDTWVQIITNATQTNLSIQIQNANVDPFSAGGISWFVLGY